MTGIIFTQPNLTKDNARPYVINVETTGSGFITNNQIDVSTTATGVWIYFNEFVKKGQGNIALREAKPTGNVHIIANATSIDTTSYATGIISLPTVSTLIDGQKYYLQIDEGVVRDRADNNVYVTNTFNFTTAYDTTPPYIINSDVTAGQSWADPAIGGLQSLIVYMSESVRDGTGSWYVRRSFVNVTSKAIQYHNVSTFTTTSSSYLISGDTVTLRPLVYRYGHYSIENTEGAVTDLATRARSPAYNNVAASSIGSISFDSPFPDLPATFYSVGGGGGGASGGGGGGQIADTTGTIMYGINVDVTIGNGGAPGVMESVPGGVGGTIYGCSSGSNGGDTTISFFNGSSWISVTAVGGGGGGGKAANTEWFDYDSYPPSEGGSGGGAGTPSHEVATGPGNRLGAAAVTATGYQRQGRAGGTAFVAGAKTPYSGGGGGGGPTGGTPGVSSTSPNYGYGGAGSTIAGVLVSRGGTGYDSTAVNTLSSYGGGGDGKVGRYTGASIVGTAGQKGVAIVQYYNASYSQYGSVFNFDGQWAVTFSGTSGNTQVTHRLLSNGTLSWV